MTEISTDSAAIDLRHASFSYGGAPQLSDVTARIERGEAVALVGPNGSGKSTLLKGILGLVDVVDGEITVLGGSPREALRRVGYLAQLSEVDREFPISLRQVVTMGRYRSLGPFGWPGRRERELVDAAITRVGLAPHAHRRFGELSGGQQQRALLARALTVEPEILLLDEPFNGLDRANRSALLDTLNSLRAEGVTIVTSTHDLELAREVCTRAMLLNRTLIAFGSVEETLKLPLVERTFEGTVAHVDGHNIIPVPPEHG
ncbi:metal ABC transporter ATP-binding protein [Klugiella xanthotipulae]|uniref:Manganese/iron transport system ATP-binding protein n=1 Tax=Klugiella xanthotipulae TaxID=244735 RepID=A0A543I6S3_9MICO|nr:metal ABC transporter ATP-binding protein [Klugiella xanthotipulae]TQM66249.1 manganese/iron transport system ATP-binding protein [Klugiella xanthotipulae]